jgi:hypothetical protein
MAPRTTSPTYSYPYPYQTVFDAIVAVTPTVAITIQGADPTTGTIWASTPMTLLKWGEKITTSLWQTQPGFTGIAVTSELKFGLMDPFGFNQRNINTLLTALTVHLDTRLAHLRTPEPPPG